jgi:hypothetical protein
MARLGLGSYKEISIEYPEYHQALLKSVFGYKDNKKKFLWKILKQIDYFKDISIEMFHRVIYRARKKYLLAGDMLLKEHDDTDSLFIIENG